MGEDIIINTLEERIMDQLDNVSSLTSGSEEETAAIDNLVKLYRLKLEEDKIRADSEEKREQRNCDNTFKRKQLEDDNRNRYFRLVLEAAGIVLPLMFYASWMRKGFKFEETGTFTSATFRNLFNRFKPTR